MSGCLLSFNHSSVLWIIAVSLLNTLLFSKLASYNLKTSKARLALWRSQTGQNCISPPVANMQLPEKKKKKGINTGQNLDSGAYLGANWENLAWCSSIFIRTPDAENNEILLLETRSGMWRNSIILQTEQTNFKILETQWEHIFKWILH